MPRYANARERDGRAALIAELKEWVEDEYAHLPLPADRTEYAQGCATQLDRLSALLGRTPVAEHVTTGGPDVER